MIEYIPIDILIHESLLIELNYEYLNEIANEVKKRYNLDLVSLIEQPIRDYAKKSVEELTSLKPPNGEFYIIKLENKIIGMGAFRKLKIGLGEVKRMYIRPEFRGKGFGKLLLKHLLKIGKEFGCSRIFLDTGQFMRAAQQVYLSEGFYERDKYPETEVPLELQPYWIYMEKKLEI